MAKKALIQKAASKPKFAVRGLPHVRALPHLRARDGARGAAARRHQVLLVGSVSLGSAETHLFVAGPAPRGTTAGKATGLHMTHTSSTVSPLAPVSAR
jgi:hypothetical protein